MASPPGRHEVWSHYCSAIQSIGLTIALLIGGGWSVYMYQQLHQSERATTELLYSELQSKNALYNLHTRFGTISLSTALLARDRQGNCFLQVTATVTNAGTREIRLLLSDTTPLSLASVKVLPNNQLDFKPLARLPVHVFTAEGDTLLALPKTRLLPGESAGYPFLLKLRQRELYRVQLTFPVDTAISDHSTSPTRGWYWTAGTYTTGCGTAMSPSSEGQADVNNLQLEVL